MLVCVPYSTKVSRCIIFAFFAVGIEPRKLNSVNFLNPVLMLTESVIRENCFREISGNANPRKLCTSNIWRSTIHIYTYIYTVQVQ